MGALHNDRWVSALVRSLCNPWSVSYLPQTVAPSAYAARWRIVGFRLPSMGRLGMGISFHRSRCAVPHALTCCPATWHLSPRRLADGSWGLLPSSDDVGGCGWHGGFAYCNGYATSASHSCLARSGMPLALCTNHARHPAGGAPYMSDKCTPCKTMHGNVGRFMRHEVCKMQ